MYLSAVIQCCYKVLADVWWMFEDGSSYWVSPWQSSLCCTSVYNLKMLNRIRDKNLSNLPGFEPGIFWSVVRRVIHCATGPPCYSVNLDSSNWKASFQRETKGGCLILFFRVTEVATKTLSYFKTHEPPAGLEPAIPGLGGRCLIHWATEATLLCWKPDFGFLET